MGSFQYSFIRRYPLTASSPRTLMGAIWLRSSRLTTFASTCGRSLPTELIRLSMGSSVVVIAETGLVSVIP